MDAHAVLNVELGLASMYYPTATILQSMLPLKSFYSLPSLFDAKNEHMMNSEFTETKFYQKKQKIANKTQLAKLNLHKSPNHQWTDTHTEQQIKCL